MKLVANKCCFTSIKMFFFIITEEFNSRINFDVVDFSINIFRKRILKRKTANILKKIKEFKKFITENMNNV